ERLRDPSRRPLIVVITDGRATAGPDAVGRSHRAAGILAAQGAGCIVVDCESGRMRLGLARTLAGYLGAEHVALAQLNAEALTDIVHGATRDGAA
ncbi:MAG: magnesium chelatase, partial [Mycobacterium sp.]